MNNFKTDIDGGLPFRLDDLRFINAAQMEAFTGVIQALVGDIPYAILNGCESTFGLNDSLHFNAGYIYFNNEIFYAPEQNLVLQFTQGDLVWEVDTSYDTAGDKAFKVDGVIHSTYEIRRAKIVEYEIQQSGGIEFNIDNVLTILKNRIGVDTSPQWTEILLTSSNVSISTTGSISGIGGSLHYKVIGKTVFIRISLNLTIDTGDINTTQISIALPTALLLKGTNEIISSIAFDSVYTSSNNHATFELNASSFLPKIGLGVIGGGNLELRYYMFHGEIFYEIN